MQNFREDDYCSFIKSETNRLELLNCHSEAKPQSVSVKLNL